MSRAQRDKAPGPLRLLARVIVFLVVSFLVMALTAATLEVLGGGL